MSKLLDNIEYCWLDERRAVSSNLPPLVETESYNETLYYPNIQQAVFVGAKFGTILYLDVKNEGDVLGYAVKNIKESLRHEMYSDCMNYLLMLERAVLQDNKDEIMSLIRDLKREVFGN